MKIACVGPAFMALVIMMPVLALPATAQDAAAAEPAPGPPAVLEYRTESWGSTIRFVEIDGQRHDAMRPSNGMGRMVRKKFELAPGRHKVGFVVEPSLALHPQWVEFEAEPGKNYRIELELATHKENDGQTTTLYYNHYVPVVLEARGKKFVRLAAGAAAPFKAQRDPAGHLLLYEDSSLPIEKTARLYCARRGLIKGAVVFFARIEGDAGATRVEYRRSSDPWKLRLLPGNYRFHVTLEGGAWQIAQVQSGIKELTLQAEAGHIYRINLITEGADTQFSKDAIGNTQMRTSFNWYPSIEDVTGKNIEDF